MFLFLNLFNLSTNYTVNVVALNRFFFPLNVFNNVVYQEHTFCIFLTWRRHLTETMKVRNNQIIFFLLLSIFLVNSLSLEITMAFKPFFVRCTDPLLWFCPHRRQLRQTIFYKSPVHLVWSLRCIFSTTGSPLDSNFKRLTLCMEPIFSLLFICCSWELSRKMPRFFCCSVRECEIELVDTYSIYLKEKRKSKRSKDHLKRINDA